MPYYLTHEAENSSPYTRDKILLTCWVLLRYSTGRSIYGWLYGYVVTFDAKRHCQARTR